MPYGVRAREREEGREIGREINPPTTLLALHYLRLPPPLNPPSNKKGYSQNHAERGREGEERGETRYLTDNVIIVSQSTGMRKVRRSVAQFPYIWVGALSDGGQREIIIVLLRGRTVLTAVGEGGVWGGQTEREME